MSVEQADTKMTENTQDLSADQKELFLVDGSGFIFRAFYALPPLTNPQGVPVGAVLGFTNMLVKLLSDLHAPYLAVIFDAARSNFRNDIYAEYKANRDETPEDLKPQFGLIRQATEAFDIPYMELEGYEADDLIATYARLAKEKGLRVTIVSSDKDLMQLVDDNVRMYDPMKSAFVGPEQVKEKFGVEPNRVIDVQALAGDSVDNVPGVPGIGIKTAAQLINEYGDLENLLANAENIKQNARRQKLIDHAEDARISYKLVRLDDNVPGILPVEDLRAHRPEIATVGEFLAAQGFKSVVSRLSAAGFMSGDEAKAVNNQSSASAANENTVREAGAKIEMPPISDNKYVLINDEETLISWCERAREKGVLAIDTETTSLTPMKAELVGISLAIDVGEAAYIPLGHSSGAQGDLLAAPSESETVPQLSYADTFKHLKSVLEDDAIIKIGHNMKYDWQMLAQHDVKMTPVDDTMLMSYVLDGTEFSNAMDEISQRLFDHKPIAYKDIVGSGKNQVTFDKVDIMTALDYAAEDADITLRFYEIFKPRLFAERKTSVYELIERPMIKIIAEMEMKGVKVDAKVLQELSRDFSVKIEGLEIEIYDLAGSSFNIGSPKQIGEVIFEQMGLKGSKKTKSGAWSTSVDVLEKLAADGHEIVEKILYWRQLSKLRSTYTEALQNEINPKTGRVHTSFSLAATSTGRLASSEPNLQNIPIRTEDGRKIRTAFIAEDGYKLMSVDYSQVELRLVAHIADIPALKKAFQDGKDIHAITASEVFDVPLEEMTSELRRSAKAINFGIIYGISAFGLSKQLDCPVGEAKRYIERYFARFPQLLEYMDGAKEEARAKGYVETLYGRKCVIGGAQDNNQARRAFADRQAINAPIQGAAADIMKLAMTRMSSAVTEAGLDIKMLLQVHDELIFEVREDSLEQASALIRGVMEDVIELSVPLIAEAGQGDNWAQAH
jgi:DNA polymerase-1